jgi:hypothetical protein
MRVPSISSGMRVPPLSLGMRILKKKKNNKIYEIFSN